MTASETEAAPIVTIAGERIALGPLRRDLLPLHQRWGNDFATARTQGDTPGPWTAERVAAWFARVAVDATAVWFTLYEWATWRPIETAHLKGLRQESDKGWWKQPHSGSVAGLDVA